MIENDCFRSLTTISFRTHPGWPNGFEFVSKKVKRQVSYVSFCCVVVLFFAVSYLIHFQIPRDFTSLFDTSPYQLDVNILPDAIR